MVTGMIKLLQRLPDGSREEVRDQAIVLVQQLTAQNEEMKKTVVFNEVRTASVISRTLTCIIHIAPTAWNFTTDDCENSCFYAALNCIGATQHLLLIHFTGK